MLQRAIIMLGLIALATTFGPVGCCGNCQSGQGGGSSTSSGESGTSGAPSSNSKKPFRLKQSDFPSDWQSLPGKTKKLTGGSQLAGIEKKLGVDLVAVVNTFHRHGGKTIQVNAIRVKNASDAAKAYRSMVRVTKGQNLILQIQDQVVEVIGPDSQADRLARIIENKGYEIVRRSR